MEMQASGQSKRHQPLGFRKRLIGLTLAGGITFWVTSIITSLLPIAAAYRAALSNWSMQTVWIASLFAGMLIGVCVSYPFLRHYSKISRARPVPLVVSVRSVHRAD